MPKSRWYISLFYLLIKLYKGTLPWITANNDNLIDIKTIKNIRQKYSTYILYEGIPIKFRKKFDIQLKLPQDECPDYKRILSSFEEMKNDHLNIYGEINIKFELFK